MLYFMYNVGENMKEKRKKILLIFLLVVLIIVIIALSFAAFSYKKMVVKMLSL